MLNPRHRANVVYTDADFTVPLVRTCHGEKYAMFPMTGYEEYAPTDPSVKVTHVHNCRFKDCEESTVYHYRPSNFRFKITRDDSEQGDPSDL
ncbi:hypothetical protein EV182_003743 [Spiromyces aspiralis]|uniref:Uncharacterized protein n=1 Tax=Spiromyces aspiralis TaxID=68401 RepID=A0ACC1HCZ7_9FUNG|nr:hypothetical protein EV182_003743 [Spiromyces aspiralis]